MGEHIMVRPTQSYRPVSARAWHGMKGRSKMTREMHNMPSWRVSIAGLLLVTNAACSGTTAIVTSTPMAPDRTTLSVTAPATSTPAPSHLEGSYKGWIAFVAELAGRYDLYLVDPQTLDVLPFGIADLPPGFPAWSPDWTRIAFFGPDYDIYVLEVSCLDRGDCRESMKRFRQGRRVYLTFSWFPDGKGVIFATKPAVGEGVPQLMTLSLNEEATSVALGDGGPNPMISPGGGTVLFDSPSGPDRLMTFNLSSHSTSLFIDPAGAVPNSMDGDWSPDGSQVAFMTSLEEGMAYGVRYEIYVAQADGTGSRIVAEKGEHPDWSPDGQSIVFEREDGLYVVNISTAVERKVLDLPRVHSAPFPAWSP
jgi:Tol biopolymer transport system component